MMKKSTSGWQLLAELRDNEDLPKANVNASVQAAISSNTRDTFLEIVWPVAVEDTFGLYRCDVVGFDKHNFFTTEVTSELALLEEDVTVSDMLIMFVETKHDMDNLEDGTEHIEGDLETLEEKLTNISESVNHQDEDISQLGDDVRAIRRHVDSVTKDTASLNGDVSTLMKGIGLMNDNTAKIDKLTKDLETLKGKVDSIIDQGPQGGKVTHLEDDVDAIRQSLNTLTGDFGLLKGDVSSLQTDIDSIDETISKDVKSLKSKVDSWGGNSGGSGTDLSPLITWPQGKFAMLQPDDGCPVDLTFFGGRDKYMRFHTESSSEGSSQNDHSDVLSPHTLSSVNDNNFLTLKFCEANGIFNTKLWPSGSYCVNKIGGAPCPSGLREGWVGLDDEDTGNIRSYTSKSTSSGDFMFLDFCCMTTGDSYKTMTLPTHNPFLLYRRGGRCQQVKDMDVSQETVTIDTEDRDNQDETYGSVPDLDLSRDSLVTMHLCYYTKA